MKHLTLQTEIRTLIGNEVRKLRKHKIIPAVIYGRKQPQTIQIQFDLNTFLKLFRESGTTSVIDIKFDDKSIPCLIHKVDVNPVTDVVRHIDFLAIDLKAKTIANVPITFVGEPEKGTEGVLVKQLSSLEVQALPEKIPREIDVDLTKLVNIGDSIKVSDLAFDKEFEILDESDSLIATLVAPDVETAAEEIAIPTTEPTITPAT
jgi:large subunit ribosomal protein L25